MSKILYLYFASCALPLVIFVIGLFWASGQQGFAAWGIIGFMITAGAYGIVNLIAGVFILATQELTTKLKLVTIVGLLIGGLIPVACLLHLLSQ